MKKKILYWFIYILFCNVALFLACALVWHAALSISLWYCFLAIPTTTIASILCGESFIILLEELTFDGDDKTKFEDFFD